MMKAGDRVMGRCLYPYNRKGGVGKSTTVQSLGAGLSRRGYKVLLIDFDEQRSLTKFVTKDFTGYWEEHTIYHVLFEDMPIEDTIQSFDEFDLAVGFKDFKNTDETFSRLFSGRDRFLVVRNAIEAVRSRYDFILLDTNPKIDLTVKNCLMAADDILLPVQCTIAAVNGLREFMEDELFPMMIPELNRDLNIVGLLPTMYKRKEIASDISLESIQKIGQEFNIPAMKPIRMAAAMEQAQMDYKSIFEYSPKSSAAQDYSQAVDFYLRSVMRTISNTKGKR